MKITKRQLRRIIREARRSLADNQYAYEGDDVGPGEIPADYRSKLYSALSPIGFETGLDPDSKYFKQDILDAMIAVERELKKAGFKNLQIIIDYITPMLADIVREHPGGSRRTEALVNAIPFDVFDAAAGGPFPGDPAPKYAQSFMYDEEEDSPPMISDSYKTKGNRFKITKRQLRRIIREEYSKLKTKGLIKEASYNTAFPFSEIAEYFMERGYKKKKAYAGDTRGSALFHMPINIQGGSKDLGYYVDVKYEYGTFYFLWYLRTKADPSSQQRIKVMKPGGGKPRWEAEYRERDLKVVMDEIDYEISVHAEEGTHPFDLGLRPSRFEYRG